MKIHGSLIGYQLAKIIVCLLGPLSFLFFSNKDIAPNPVEFREPLPSPQYAWLLRGTLRSSLGHRYKSREPRVSCHNLRKTLRLLLQRVLSPDFPTMTREHLWAPPHHTHRDLTFLAPHERLPELPVVPREKTHTCAPKKNLYRQL